MNGAGTTPAELSVPFFLQLIAGVILGSSLPGLLAPQSPPALFPAGSKPILFVVAPFGVGVYIFLIGLGFQSVPGGAADEQDNDTAMSIDALMNARGPMKFIVIDIGLQRGLIGPAMFSILALMAIVTMPMPSLLFEHVYGRRARASGASGALNDAQVPEVRPCTAPEPDPKT